MEQEINNLGSAIDFKDKGNVEFRAGRYKEAAELYSKAIELDSENATLYSNRANAYVQLNLLEKAAEDAEKCIRLRPEWEKGWYRKGSALEALGDLDQALSAYQRALQSAPDNKDIQTKVRNLKKQLDRSKKKSSKKQSSKPHHEDEQQGRHAQQFGPSGQLADRIEQMSAVGAGGMPSPAAWARGLPPAKQAEWLVDCYRVRVDDDYAWGGCNLHGVYDPECTKASVCEDFLIFCKLAVKHNVIPQAWNWSKFLTTAANLLPYAFEKSDAKDKWGGENVFTVAVGGRSLRYTGEVVYGSSIMGGERPEYIEEIEDSIVGMWRELGDDVFADVGGVAAWRKLYSNLRLHSGAMY